MLLQWRYVALIVAVLGLALGLELSELRAQLAPGKYPAQLNPSQISQQTLKVDNSTTPNRTEIGCETDQLATATVNGLRFTGGATGVDPAIAGVACTGGDSNRGITVTPAGAGTVTLGGIKTDNFAFLAGADVCTTDVPWSTAANLQPARVAAGDYALARTAAGAETYNVNCTIPLATFRTTASKGVRIDSLAFVYQVTVVALTNHDQLTLTSVAYANNVANAVAAYGGALSSTSLSTATQANPYVTTITPGTPAFFTTAGQLTTTWRVVMANTGVYRLYGILVTYSTALY